MDRRSRSRFCPEIRRSSVPLFAASCYTFSMTPLCPGCRAFTFEGSTFYPFCSERCRLVDLGAWLNADYRVPEDSQPSLSISAEGASSNDP